MADGSEPGRRAFLRRVGIGGAAAVGGALAGHEVIPHGHVPAAQAAESGADGHDAADDPYGHAVDPPAFLEATSLDAATFPPRRDGRPPGSVREHTIEVTARPHHVGEGAVADAWTYGGSVPGPTIRATEGDTLRLRVRNLTEHAHNLHLHGRHSPAMDGWEPIAPGDEFTYEVIAGPAGVHPYHCHTPPLAEHIARGLYGTLIVDPAEPREPALEVVLMLSGWDLDGDGRNELVTWNGVAGYYARFPIKVETGLLVRAYVLNMTEYEAVGSFHLHGEMFDVYRTGTRAEPDEHTDTVTLGQGERAIVEFRLPERGRYMFHPHQHHLAERGAMGWFAAI